MAIRPGGAMVQSPIPTRSQLIPILSNWRQLRDKSQLGAMAITVVAILLMYAFIDDKSVIMVPTGPDPLDWVFTSKFLILVGSYLSLLSLYFLYRLAGKRKSWLAMLGCAVFTGYFLWLFKVQHDFGFLYEFFHQFLAGGEASNKMPFVDRFFRHFVGTGFFEEFVKAIPLLLLLWYTPKLKGPQQEAFALREPLDGILFGAASGGGFALMETLLQYVPQDLVSTWLHVGVKVANVANGTKLTSDAIEKLLVIGMQLVGAAPGAQLLIPRSLDETFGHMAYSGYLGYFIGLAALKPANKWKTLAVGYVSASLCHALWDSANSTFADVIIGVLSYAVLAAAILKAREISPNRMLLQPSIVFGAVLPNAAPAAAHDIPSGPGPFTASAAQRVEARLADLPNGTGAAAPASSARLRIGIKTMVIVPGLKLLEHQVPGLRAQSPGGPVAEVTRNPQDQTILGLTNLSTSVWQVINDQGRIRQIQAGQTFKLSPGTKIDFGSVDGEVTTQVAVG